MLSPLLARSAFETASPAEMAMPKREVGALQRRVRMRKRSGAEYRAITCWRACSESRPPMFTPAIFTPWAIVFGGPAEGAIATAANSTSTSDRTARFQSAIRTKEEAARFTTGCYDQRADVARKSLGRKHLAEPVGPRSPGPQADEVFAAQELFRQVVRNRAQQVARSYLARVAAERRQLRR